MKEISILLVILLFGRVSYGQESTLPDFTFNHLALSVTDLDKSVEFYTKVLNLKEISNRTQMQGIRWFSLGEDKELHLISTIREDVLTNKAVHMALTTSNFDGFVELLDKMDIQYSDWPGAPQKINIRADGIRQIFFQDPDGYWIEVNSAVDK